MKLMLYIQTGRERKHCVFEGGGEGLLGGVKSIRNFFERLKVFQCPTLSVRRSCKRTRLGEIGQTLILICFAGMRILHKVYFTKKFNSFFVFIFVSCIPILYNAIVNLYRLSCFV